MMRDTTKKEKEFLLMLGNNLAKLRQAKGFTQAQLAAKVDLPPATIWRYENAETGPNVVVLHRIADALGVSLHEIFFSMVDKNKDIGNNT